MQLTGVAWGVEGGGEEWDEEGGRVVLEIMLMYVDIVLHFQGFKVNDIKDN